MELWACASKNLIFDKKNPIELKISLQEFLIFGGGII